MRRAAKRFGLLLGIAATVALVLYARNVLGGQDLSRFASAGSLLAVVVAALCYSLIVPISAWAWRRLLSDYGAQAAWSRLTEIMAIAQLGKYIPGNVAVHLGRVGIAMSQGLPGGALVLSLLAETALAVAAALAIGVLGLLLSSPGLQVLHEDIGRSIAMASAVFGAVVVLVLLLRGRLLALATTVARRRAWNVPERLLPRVGTGLRAFLAYAGNYLVIGLGLWLMARMLLPGAVQDAGLLCAAFALAWVAGYFAPGAPAGFGIREGLMLGILRLSYPAPDALVLVIALRLATMLGDTLCFLGGYLMLLSSRTRAHRPT